MPAAEAQSLLRKLLTLKWPSVTSAVNDDAAVNQAPASDSALASAPSLALSSLADRTANSSAPSLSTFFRSITRSSSTRSRTASHVSVHSVPASPSTIATFASPTRKPSVSSDLSSLHPQVGADGLSGLKYLGTHCTLPLARVEAEVTPVPGTEELMECLSLVFQAAEHARVNKVQWRVLQGRCVIAVRLAAAQVAGQDQPQSPELAEIIHKLANTLRSVYNCAQKYRNMDEVVEFLCFRSMSKEIQTFFSELDSGLKSTYHTPDARLQWEEEFHAVQELELEELERVYRLLSMMSPGLGGTNSGSERPLGKTDKLSEEVFNDGSRDAESQMETLQSKEMASSSVEDMFHCLTRHGCSDLTQSVDHAAISLIPTASGGSGDVWKGRLQDGAVIAIKVWRLCHMREGETKYLKQATRELYNWSKMDHENIHELLGVTIFRNHLGMISRWMEEGNLQEYIQNNANVDRYQLCVQVTKAVQYLHSKNRVHGDLKACNFLVSSDGIVKLTDFGHSIISDVSLKFSETNSKGGGTLRWMAPELLAHPPHCRNKRTDIHALGMTLLEIITDDLPYPQLKSYPQVFGALMAETLPECTFHFQDGKGRRMWSLLTQCWDRDPDKRPTANNVLILLILITETSYPQSPHSIVDSYLNAQQIVPTILTVTKFCLPPQLLTGNECAGDIDDHIKDGSTCYVYDASLLGEIRVAKKVFKIEKEKNNHGRVKRYAEHLTKVVTKWNTFKSEYVLPIYGIGMELLEGDKHFHLYMLTPFMENLDAMSYLENRRDKEGMKKSILRIALEHERDEEVPQAVAKGRKQSRRWMAPELINRQINSPFSPSTSSDVWGWAMAALEIISGSMPYHSDDDIFAVMRRVIKGPPMRGDHTKFEVYAWHPNETWELFKGCWSNEPNDRLGMGDVVLKLKEISDKPDQSGALLTT